jgi:hypothetical protein
MQETLAVVTAVMNFEVTMRFRLERDQALLSFPRRARIKWTYTHIQRQRKQ